MGGGSLSDNQMIGFSLPIIFDSVSLPSPLASGAPQRSERKKEKKKNKALNLSFCPSSHHVHKDYLSAF